MSLNPDLTKTAHVFDSRSDREQESAHQGISRSAVTVSVHERHSFRDPGLCKGTDGAQTERRTADDIGAYVGFAGLINK